MESEIATLRADLARAREEVDDWKRISEADKADSKLHHDRALAAERARDEALAALRDMTAECTDDPDEDDWLYQQAIDRARRVLEGKPTMAEVILGRDEAMDALKRIVILWGSYQRPRGEPPHVLFAEFNDTVEAARRVLAASTGEARRALDRTDGEG